MKLLTIFACLLAAAGPGLTLDQGYRWSPNVEYTFEYTSPNLMKAFRNSGKHVSTFDGNPLKLVAQAKVQAFGDMTLRVKLDQILFYSNGHIVSQEKAHQILRDETSNLVGINHNDQTFTKMLTTPFLLHIKRGMVKKMIVNRNEPTEVVKMKKLIASNLEKKSGHVHLQILMKTAIIIPLETPRFPMKIDIDASTVYNAEGRSNGESGRYTNRRNLVRGVENAATSFISGERNDSLALNGLLYPPYCSSMCPHCGNNYMCGGVNCGCTKCDNGCSWSCDEDGKCPIECMIPLCSKCDMESTSEWRLSWKYHKGNVEECKQVCIRHGAHCVGIDSGINGRKGECWLNFGSFKGTVSHNDFNSWKKNPACEPKCTSNSDCGQNAECKTNKVPADCVCSPGYVGDPHTLCEQHAVDACAGYQCANGGSCIQINGTPKCNCPNGFSGNHCEKKDCIVSGIDYYLGDLDLGKETTTDTKEKCQRLCQDTPDCLYFTWVSDAFSDSSKHKRCFLKGKLAGEVKRQGLYSGPKYCSVRIAPGTLCADQYLQEIEYEAQCKESAKQLGFQWKGTVDGENDFPGCFRAEDGSNLVYFNTNRNAGRIYLSSEYAGICNLGSGIPRKCYDHLLWAATTGKYKGDENKWYGNIKKITGVEPHDASFEDLQRAFRCNEEENSTIEKECNTKGLEFPLKCTYPPCNTCSVKQPVCKTIGGPSENAFCKFPFTYENITYNECAYNSMTGFWCPTVNDITIHNNTGWGKCGIQCPLTDNTGLNTVKKIGLGKLCGKEGMFEMVSETKCKAAAAQLGFAWGKSWDGPKDFPGCFYAEDGRKKVFFNTSPYPGRADLSRKYAAICKVPEVEIIKAGTLCSSAGLNEINSKDNCQAAALRLGLTWTGRVTSKMPGCSTNNNNVYFNVDPNPRMNELPNTYSEICEDIVGVNRECPNEEDLPVLNERGDKFYCAFSWDERGGEIARKGCKGTKTVWMDGDDFSVDKNINKGMLSTGSIMVEVGCTLIGYQNPFKLESSEDIEYNHGIYPDGCKIVEGNKTVCPPVNPTNERYGNGFRSFSCRCRQTPIICQPTDEWVVITSYDNSESSSKGKCNYNKKIGTTWSSEAQQTRSIGASVSASVTTSFFNSFEATLGIEGSTEYNWGETTSETKSEETSLEVEHKVNPYQTLLVMNVQGKCGGSTVKTEMFKFVTTDYSTPENITTEYVIHDTNRQVSMELSNFN